VTDRRVLFFGDSIVAGIGDPSGRGWVGRVVAASWAAGLALTAYPLGVRRQTSVEVARRWRDEARPRLICGADCRVVFAVGVNDTTIEDGTERVAPERSEATLARMLDEAAARGLPAFVVGPAPVCDTRPGWSGSPLSPDGSGSCRRRSRRRR
jgi:lysophospholipase L1-like esterase